jgi:hypothetical protein
MKKASVLIVVATMATIFSALLLECTKTFAAAMPLGSRDVAAAEHSLQEKIVSKEREGLDALKTGNLELFGNLTADDAVLVDAHGPASKAQLLQNVAGFKLTDYSMGGMEFVPLSAESGLISYKIGEKGVSHGKEFAAEAYVSSVWMERAGKWVCVFSQETPAR